jgi:hypothetical protein
MFGSWITSNYMADSATTATVWYAVETLSIVGAFYAPSALSTTVSVVVYDESNTVLTTQSFTAAPFGAQINATSLVIGSLPVGYYRVCLKIRQGGRVIGQQMWVQVLPTPAR